MRNISFMLTTRQVLAEQKTVTRRLGWLHVKTGDLLQGVEKCQGLGKGGTMKRLKVIRVVSVRRERLGILEDDIRYGRAEIDREGFRDDPRFLCPAKWVQWFCNSHKGCTPETEVTRIEFEYVAAKEATQ